MMRFHTQNNLKICIVLSRSVCQSLHFLCRNIAIIIIISVKLAGTSTVRISMQIPDVNTLPMVVSGQVSSLKHQKNLDDSSKRP